MPAERRITLDGFLAEFQAQDQNQPDCPFCFILGAGASKPSEIRTGAELARHFLREMYDAENFASEPLEQWATADRLGIAGFELDRAEEFYPQLYQRKFARHPDRGYAFLEKEMAGREPSYGYSVLAWILAQKQHKVVITTNFDNLVADALSIHSSTFPRIVGHDALAQFVHAVLRRPLIAKIHGDLGFNPRNTPEETAELPGPWKVALERVLQRFTPIVIGYGGNDGGLMGTLEALPPNVPESIYWCQREGAAASPRVVALLEQRAGRLVSIPGFDELMLMLQSRMKTVWGMPDLLEAMEGRQRKRVNSCRDQFDKLGAALAAPPKTARDATDRGHPSTAKATEERDLANAAVSLLTPDKEEKPWWQWYLEADRESDDDKKDAIFQAGFAALPKSADLLGAYANFLVNKRKDFDQAEQFYKRAWDANPSDAGNLGNYALFLAEQRKDFEGAAQFFKRALEVDPNHANNLGNYALFLDYRRKDFDQAEQFYKRAVEADPNHANNLSNYATFLALQCHDYDRAEEYYKRAREADPDDFNVISNFTGFLLGEGQREKGLELLTRAEAAIEDRPDRAIELAFYRLAHDPKKRRDHLRHLKELIGKGARSPGWSFERNVERAEKDGFLDLPLLRALARVITDGEIASNLDAFPAWRSGRLDN